MTFRKLLIILTFIVTAVIIMLLSTSYAWYQFDNAVTSFTNVQTFTQGLDELAVVFTNDDNINTTIGVPILAADVAELSNKTTFSLTPSSDILSGKEVAFQISLVDLSVDTPLTKTTDLKYSLLETIGSGATTTIASGDFNGFNDDSLILKSMTEITQLDVTYSYEFRIWLEESGADQNSLMGQSVKGRINISTIIR